MSDGGVPTTVSRVRAGILKSSRPGHRLARGGMWLPFLVGLLLRVVSVLYFDGPFYFLDDEIYDRVGWQLALEWGAGEWSFANLQTAAGAISSGFWAYVGGIYVVFGHSWLAMKLISALIAAFSVPLAATAAGRLSGESSRLPAAWLVALYPAAIFWAGQGLKDGITGTLLLACIALCLGPFSLSRLLAAIAVTGAALWFRIPLGLALLVLLLTFLLYGLRREGGFGRSRGTAALAVSLGALAAAYVARPFLEAGLSALRAGAITSDSAALAQGAGGIDPIPGLGATVRAALGPFPWTVGLPGTDNIYSWLYPGVVVWIVVLPAAIVGAGCLLRRGDLRQRGLLASALVYLLLYQATLGDAGFFRQRYGIELVAILFFLVAFRSAPHLAGTVTSLGLCAIALAALIQSDALTPTLLAGALGACFLLLIGVPGLRQSSRAAASDV